MNYFQHACYEKLCYHHKSLFTWHEQDYRYIQVKSIEKPSLFFSFLNQRVCLILQKATFFYFRLNVRLLDQLYLSSHFIKIQSYSYLKIQFFYLLIDLTHSSFVCILTIDYFTQINLKTLIHLIALWINVFIDYQWIDQFLQKTTNNSLRNESKCLVTISFPYFYSILRIYESYFLCYLRVIQNCKFALEPYFFCTSQMMLFLLFRVSSVIFPTIILFQRQSRLFTLNYQNYQQVLSGNDNLFYYLIQFNQSRLYDLNMKKERNNKGDNVHLDDNHSVRSDKSKMDSDIINENITNFDQAKIIQHYRRMKETQYHHLATLNMSEELKKKLFGFSDGYYVTNEVDPANLIVLNHPMQGRLIMTKQKYRHGELCEHRKREINQKEDPNNSVSRVFSGEEEGMNSDIPQMDEFPPKISIDAYHKSEANLVEGKLQSI